SAQVVAAERQHGERVAAQFADLAFGGGGLLAGDVCVEEDAVVPVEGLRDEGDGGGAAADEEDRGDRHALGVLPLGRDDRALRGGGGEAGVGVGGRGARLGRPVVALPVGQVGRDLLGHALPPHVAVVGEGDVGEDGVAPEGLHGVGVG